MSNSMAETAREIGRDFPAFQVWYVPSAVGAPTWYARRWDDPVDAPHTLAAPSAPTLVHLLEAEASK